MNECSLISAVNDDGILGRCLLGSTEAQSAKEIILQRGFSSAAGAYNAAIEKAEGELLVLAHQDVFLPEGWFEQLERAVAEISQKDANWGVLGAWGVKRSGEGAGFTYCVGNREVLGKSFSGGIEVETLDEMVLILRKASGLRFDETLEGFHMYGTDICLEARRRGMKSYAIAAFCVHNTNQYGMLPLRFWQNYVAMRRKWKAYLPVWTTCIQITRGCWPLARWNVVRALNLLTGRDKPPVGRVEDPARLYQDVLGLVTPRTNARFKPNC